MNKNRGIGFISLVLLLSFFLLPCVAFGESLDNKGRDFIMGFLPNFTGNLEALELHLTGDVATTVTVEYPVNAPTFTTTAAIVPGTVTIVSLPLGAHRDWTSGSVLNNCVRAFAGDEFVCYMINIREHTSDAALALPIDTMNTEYIVTTWDGDTPEFVVVAAFDTTDVTITPPGGSAYTVSLNRGEGYMSQGGGDMTGTSISATLPVGMTNGNRCVNYDGSACDHIFEVAVPVQAWGDFIPAANLPETSLGVRYKILAGNDDITILINGVSQGTLNRGDFILTNRLADDVIIEGTNADPDHLNPIFAVQFMANRESSGGEPIGDPAMGNMVPAEQYLGDYTFSTVGGDQFIENNVTIIAEQPDIATLELDGLPVGAGSFTQIGTSNHYAAIIEIAEGVHTTSSAGMNTHGITVEGFNWYDSYLYPGGALFEFINPQGDENPPECGCDFTDTAGDCTASDDRPSEDTNDNGVLDEGEDLNGNGVIDEDTGIFFVALAEGAVNLVLTVDAFVPGDGTVDYSVGLIDPLSAGNGVIRVTDGAGNICETVVTLNEQGESCGDLDGDGDVDNDDRVILTGALGTCAGDPGYIADADYDGNECITFSDYRLWYACYKDSIVPD